MSIFGIDKEELAKDLDCKIEEIIDLSSTINFVKPEINLDFNNLDIFSYPSYKSLYEKIAKNYKIDKEEIELFNGSNSAIFTLFGYLNLKHCSIYAPSSFIYKKACIKFAYELKLINRLDNINFPIKEGSLVIFANPSNPDGNYYDLEMLIEYWIEKNCTILIDETYLDFSQKDSVIKYLPKYDKLYILKSMSKFYSSGGIRISAIVSNKNNIEKLKRFEPILKLSKFDVHYLEESFNDFNFKKIAKTLNIKNKIELANILKTSKFVDKVYETCTNFVFVKLKNIKAQEFQSKLRKYKIVIKICDDFDFLDDSFIRISVNSSLVNKKLKKAMVEIC